MRDASGTQGTALMAHPRGAGFRVLSRMARSVAEEPEETHRPRWEESVPADAPDPGEVSAAED